MENYDSKKIMSYAVMGLAALECILPFMYWIKVPLYNSISSFFGGSGNSSSYSLFGYVGTVNSGSQFVHIVVMILAAGAILQIILNVLFLYKVIVRKQFNYKYTGTASFLFLIAAVIFLVIVGLTSLVLQVIKLTCIPLLAAVVSASQIVLIKKSR